MSGESGPELSIRGLSSLRHPSINCPSDMQVRMVSDHRVSPVLQCHGGGLFVERIKFPALE